MKTILTLALLLLLSPLAQGQAGTEPKEEVLKLKKGTLIITKNLEESLAGSLGDYKWDTLNKLIPEIMTKHWTFSKVRFVSDRKAMNEALKSDYNFGLSAFRDENGTIQLLISHKGFAKRLAYFSFDNRGDLVVLLKPAILCMQQYLNAVVDGKITGEGWKDVFESANKYYRQDLQTVKQPEKELWLVSGNKMKPLEEFKKNYPYNVKIATRKQVQEAIDTQNENVIIGYGYYSMVVFFNASNGKPILFFDNYPANSFQPSSLLGAMKYIEGKK